MVLDIKKYQCTLLLLYNLSLAAQGRGIEYSSKSIFLFSLFFFYTPFCALVLMLLQRHNGLLNEGNNLVHSTFMQLSGRQHTQYTALYLHQHTSYLLIASKFLHRCYKTLTTFLTLIQRTHFLLHTRLLLLTFPVIQHKISHPKRLCAFICILLLYGCRIKLTNTKYK